jgi:hypothetical protein
MFKSSNTISVYVIPLFLAETRATRMLISKDMTYFTALKHRWDRTRATVECLKYQRLGAAIKNAIITPLHI